MRRVADPRFGIRTAGANTIEGDRSCGSCGYNLKGLAAGGLCPECGTPIRARASPSEAAPELLEAPRWLVLAIGWACFGLLGVVILKHIVLFIMTLLKASELWKNAALSCFGIAWVVGVVLVTLPRPGRPEMKWMEGFEFSSRWAARLLAIAVPGVHLCGVAMLLAQAAATAPGAAAPFNSKPWEMAILATQIVYFASFVPLIWTVSNLAVSCADHAVTWRTRSVIGCFAWTYLMQGLMVIAGAAGAGWIFGLIGVFTWGIGWLIFLIGLGQIGAMMLWAISYNDGAAERERRRIQREREARDRFPAPAPVSPIGPERPRVSRPGAPSARAPRA